MVKISPPVSYVKGLLYHYNQTKHRTTPVFNVESDQTKLVLPKLIHMSYIGTATMFSPIFFNGCRRAGKIPKS